MPIYDTKRRVNDLSQMVNIELRHDTTGERVCGQPLDPGDELSGKALSRIRHAFTRVIGLQVFKVFNCRRGKCY